MSPFTIFFLVVTFLYIIYYAVIITIDMNAKPKSEADNSETLDTEGMVASEGESDDTSDNPDDDEDSTSAPASDNPLPYNGDNDENQENDQQSDEPDETSAPAVPEPEDDNPYGLSDEEPSPSDTPAIEPSATAEAIAAGGATPDTDEPSEAPTDEHPSEQEQVEQREQKEPEVQVIEPIHENGGLAEDINNSNETIEAESLTPCKPNMLASNVFDIAKINRSFYGKEQPPESTLSEKQPMQNNEESVIMDKI